MMTSLKIWFKLFPGLSPFGMKCPCGIPSKGFKPYLHGDFIGIKASECECGTPGKVRTIPRNEKTNKMLKQYFYNFTGLN